MTKPQSYPFMQIAKRYGLDYGDVLTVADMWRHPAERSDRERAADKRLATTLWLRHTSEKVILLIERLITEANHEFAAIQAGLIDWNTGERVNTQAIGRGLRDVPKPGVIIDYAADLDLMRPLKTLLLDEKTLKPVDCPLCGHYHSPGTTCGEHANGAPMYAADGTMLDDKGNRSIFDDVDE